MHVAGGWAVTSTIVFRGKKHTLPVLGPCAARTEPSLWRLLAVDTMISNPFLAARSSGRVGGKRRLNVRVTMTGPVDQRVMMIFSLLEVQKAIALEHCLLQNALDFLRRRRVSQFHIRDQMEPPATCVL